MHQINAAPVCALVLLYHLNLLPSLKTDDSSVSKYLLAYPYIGPGLTSSHGTVCASKFYKGYHRLTGQHFEAYKWRNDSEDTFVLEGDQDLRFRQAADILRCPDQPRTGIGSVEDKQTDMCMPYMFGTYVGWFLDIREENPKVAQFLKDCGTNQICSIVKDSFGTTCKNYQGRATYLPCAHFCEHYHWTCDPGRLFLSNQEYAFYSPFFLMDPYEAKQMVIVNKDTLSATPAEQGTSSRFQRITGREWAQTAQLPECNTDQYRKQLPAYDVGCISEDAMRLFTYFHTGVYLLSFKNTTAYENHCKKTNTKPAICTFRGDGTQIPSCNVGTRTEPCYRICHHALITCVPPYGLAYSEAQDSLIALSRSPRRFQARAQTYIGPKATTYNGKPCQSPSFATESQPRHCTNQPIENLPSNETFKSRPFFPYCFTDGTNIEPCFPVCRKHDPQLNHIRHLGYRSRKELERIEKETSPHGVPPLILFPSRRQQGGFEVFCGTKMQYAHLFKHLPGSIECFDMNPIGIETADPTKPYHDLLILKASAHVITEAKEGRMHEGRRRFSVSVDKEYPGCRPKGNYMGSYTGTTAVTINRHVCQRWDAVDGHHYRDDNFPDGSVARAKNYCRNPDKSPCGPWCYYKTSKSFKREPCFHTCVQLQNEKHVACRPGPVLQWSDRNMFEVQIVNKTRTGQPCVAENKEMHYSSREPGRLYPSMRKAEQSRTRKIVSINEKVRKASCWEAEANSYLGPMCYRNDSRKEACYYACEHRNLFCIDRDHMLNIEYNGPKNTTIHGLPCMQWVDVIALVKRDLFNYQWKWIFQDGDASAIAEIFSEPTDHNQCLNILTLLKVQSNYYEFPGIDPVILKGPICFVNVQDFIVPQPCFMTCEDMSIEENNCIEKESIRTAIYTGFRNRSKTGKPCRRWDEKIFDFNVPWEITGPLHNYCRNYGNYEHGPWCYVLRGGVEREQCFDVCPESKTIISYKESDHNWQYDPCTEHSECCEGKSYFMTTLTNLTQEGTN
ncbi:hypothetical protein M513_08998 [Trichuris suis]|uniref:Kringle domain-containing protein n=1 Tax=Trichuris suis TaxID=68888 RepID=A0A085LYW3_9BILA|nr:hypothetical protein M513_08998 [Trichuris suis]